jgi:phage terminase large subunit
MQTITLPYNFTPRDYQKPLFRAIDSGFKRAVVIWHRRAGKDKSLINIISKKAMERVGTYYYLFPTYKQGKKIIWNGMDKDGFKFINHIPEAIVKRKDSTDMLVELINGSIIQIVGTDNIDSIVGTNPVGCVFSEYALQDPTAWSFLRPILQENGGFAIFNYTPRGDNHGKTLYEAALKRENWYVELRKADETGVFTKEQLDEELNELKQEHGDDEGLALFEQEYLCSFSSPVIGSYYGSLMQRLEKDGRVRNIPYDPIIPVHTWWDLGVGDATCIGFVQQVGLEIRLIDYYETSGEGIPHYASVLNSKGYSYGTHYAPHDIEVRELGTGRSRLEIAREHGINFRVVARQSIEDGIEALRSVLPRVYFDETKTELLMAALKNYHKAYDEKRKIYKDHPEHDWSSHGADMMRYMATSIEEEQPKKTIKQKHYDPYTGRLLS